MSIVSKKQYESVCDELDAFEESMTESYQQIKNKGQLLDAKLAIISSQLQSHEEQILQQGANKLIEIRCKIKNSKIHLRKLSSKYETKIDDIRQQFNQQLYDLSCETATSCQAHNKKIRVIETKFIEKIDSIESLMNQQNQMIQSQINNQEMEFRKVLADCEQRIKGQKQFNSRNEKQMVAAIENMYNEESEKIRSLGEKRKAHKLAFLELLENIVVKIKEISFNQSPT